MSDERVIEELIQVRGIGRWSAHMFLIFALGRPDVFPFDDLGIRSAIRRLYALDDLPAKEISLEIGNRWRPYASIGSWYCWRFLDSEPAQPFRSETKSGSSVANKELRPVHFEKWTGRLLSLCRYATDDGTASSPLSRQVETGGAFV